MKKLKITIALFFVSVLGLNAQSFQEPFSDYFSMKECYVVTNDGEFIHGKLRSAADSRGFITRVTIVDRELSTSSKQPISRGLRSSLMHSLSLEL